MAQNSSASCPMKQVLERHLSVSVTKCVWSPKLELLLSSNIHGQVLLQRHRSLERVWSVAPPSDQTRVTGLAWRPDSNIIAIAYQTGVVLLVTLETGTVVHRFQVDDAVTSLVWQQHNNPASVGDKDIWSEYMAPLPSSDKRFTDGNDTNGSEQGTWQNSHILHNQLHLTLLVIGTSSGVVLLYAFGLVHCATIDVAAAVPGARQILSAHCSIDMNLLSVVLERTTHVDNKDVAHVVVDMTVVAERHRELYTLAHKYAEIQALFNYSANGITQLHEAWEGILLEMDTKLDAYSGLKGKGEVSADFLDLLVIGYAGNEFYSFLTNKLTEKGLKKLRQSVELGYTNMHKLVVKQLEAVGQGLVFVISQVVGMARTSDRYNLLGVQESVVNDTLKEAGAFLLKTSELQKVILLSMKNFLAFIKWLSYTHLRIIGSNVPPDLAKTTNEEQTDVFNFLSSIEDIIIDDDGKKRRQFKLESVSQYLQDETLASPLEYDNNPWLTFLEEHPEVSNSPLILPQRRTTSLVQEHNRLSEQLNRLSAASIKAIGKNIRISEANSLFPLTGDASDIIITQASRYHKKMHLMVVPESNSKNFYFCEWNTDVNEIYLHVHEAERRNKIKVGSFTFSPSTTFVCSPNVSCESDQQIWGHSIIDAQFYTGDVLSLLMEDSTASMRSFFVQVAVAALCSELSDQCSLCHVQPVELPREATSVRRLDVSAGILGVSGERKVAVVVARHRRTMLHYEMEVDEEDEDDHELEQQDHSQ